MAFHRRRKRRATINTHLDAPSSGMKAKICNAPDKSYFVLLCVTQRTLLDSASFVLIGCKQNPALRSTIS